MKKTISILSIVSIVVAAVSLLLAIGFLSVFWKPMCMLFSAPQEVVAAGPIIPTGKLVYMVGCLVVAPIICVCAKSNKTIVIEIISIILLSAVLPVLAWRLSMVQTYEIGYTMGAKALTVLSIADDITSFARGLMNISAALCLVVCGMSISEKVHTKKANSSTIQITE